MGRYDELTDRGQALFDAFCLAVVVCAAVGLAVWLMVGK